MENIGYPGKNAGISGHQAGTGAAGGSLAPGGNGGWAGPLTTCGQTFNTIPIIPGPSLFALTGDHFRGGQNPCGVPTAFTVPCLEQTGWSGDVMDDFFGSSTGPAYVYCAANPSATFIANVRKDLRGNMNVPDSLTGPINGAMIRYDCTNELWSLAANVVTDVNDAFFSSTTNVVSIGCACINNRYSPFTGSASLYKVAVMQDLRATTNTPANLLTNVSGNIISFDCVNNTLHSTNIWNVAESGLSTGATCSATGPDCSANNFAGIVVVDTLPLKSAAINSALRPLVFDNLVIQLTPGSGGAANINSGATPDLSGGGGGAGGAICVITNRLSGNGTINAFGGNAGVPTVAGQYLSGGGGGVILIRRNPIYDSSSFTYNVSGGLGMDAGGIHVPANDGQSGYVFVI